MDFSRETLSRNGDERLQIAPRLSAEQYGEIYQDIALTLSELLEERPEACELLRGRTFARTLH